MNLASRYTTGFNGNGTGTKNALWFSESKTILYLDTVYCKFLLCVSVEIDPFKHRYFSTQTNLLVYVTMITGTRSTVVRGVTRV